MKAWSEGKFFLGENINDNDMLKIDKEKLIAILTEELPVLRAKLGLNNMINNADEERVKSLINKIINQAEERNRRLKYRS